VHAAARNNIARIEMIYAPGCEAVAVT
jgi:hypothetical protein